MNKMLDVYLTKNAPQTKRAPITNPTGVEMKTRVSVSLASDLEIKALGEIPDGYVAGWASTNSVDSYGHVVETGAFQEAIEKRGLLGPAAIKFLIGHKWDQLGGVIKRLEYRGDRLWIEAQLNLEISYVKDAYEAAKMLGGTNFSVGFFIRDYQWKGADGDDVLHITKGDLFEVSMVPFPGNEECVMEFIKEGNSEDPMTLAKFEQLLISKELVEGRNNAHSIVQMVKKNLHLFKADEEVEGHTQTLNNNTKASNLQDATLTEMSALVARMKKTLQSAKV